MGAQFQLSFAERGNDGDRRQRVVSQHKGKVQFNKGNGNGMIALTRGIGESLLSLTSKGSAEPPAPTYEPETLAFESRVLSDGGKILDIEKLDNFYKVNKAIGKYNSLQFAVSKQF